MNLKNLLLMTSKNSVMVAFFLMSMTGSIQTSPVPDTFPMTLSSVMINGKTYPTDQEIAFSLQVFAKKEPALATWTPKDFEVFNENMMQKTLALNNENIMSATPEVQLEMPTIKGEFFDAVNDLADTLIDWDKLLPHNGGKDLFKELTENMTDLQSIAAKAKALGEKFNYGPAQFIGNLAGSILKTISENPKLGQINLFRERESSAKGLYATLKTMKNLYTEIIKLNPGQLQNNPLVKDFFNQYVVFNKISASLGRRNRRLEGLETASYGLKMKDWHTATIKRAEELVANVQQLLEIKSPRARIAFNLQRFAEELAEQNKQLAKSINARR